MKTKYTPGPWEVKGSKIDSEYGTVATTESHGASLEKDGRFGAYKDYEANAKLIAAAPELLEALEYLVSLIDEGVNPIIIRGGNGMAISKEAVSKAKGR